MRNASWTIACGPEEDKKREVYILQPDSDFNFRQHISQHVNPVYIIYVISIEIGLTYLYLLLKKSTALITSRLDYCNSLLNSIAKKDLAQLQQVGNYLARVVLRATRFSASLPILKQLHWLLVTYRFKVELSTPTYSSLSTKKHPI